MAEGARLESVYTGNRIGGSNPPPSASHRELNALPGFQPPRDVYGHPRDALTIGGRYDNLIAGVGDRNPCRRHPRLYAGNPDVGGLRSLARFRDERG